ncbi:unnamed protein product [marine sediment metagenome]|uniref:Uncharacterized protein n=1 Tax=marine sediment metagenome TaxID=412755 RepID=X1CZL6_9ZZZZ
MKLDFPSIEHTEIQNNKNLERLYYNQNNTIEHFVDKNDEFEGIFIRVYSDIGLDYKEDNYFRIIK